MRRVIVIALCALSFLIALPARAHAWWYWLDEYSGPGPFTGPNVQFRVVCVNDPLPEREPSTEAGKRSLAILNEQKRLSYLALEDIRQTLATEFQGTNNASLKIEPEKLLLLSADARHDLLLKLKVSENSRLIIEQAVATLEVQRHRIEDAQNRFDEEVQKIRRSSDPGNHVLRSIESFGAKNGHTGWSRAAATAAGVGCIIGGNKNPIASLNVRSSYLWSLHNRLDYVGKPEPTVRLFQNELSFSAFVDQNKSIELVTAAGISRVFTKSSTTFDPFSRFYWKPIELNVAPVPLLRSVTGGKAKWWDNAVTRPVTFSSSIVYMPRGFVAKDFGATGDFKVDKELVGLFGLFWDLSRF